MGSFKDLTGQKFGMLTVVSSTGERKQDGAIIWNCICECGSLTTATTASLKNGHKQTCGNHCRKRNFISKETRLYRSWQNMKNRCYWEKDKSFANYGGRGIQVCPEWRDDFSVFRKWALSSGYQDNLTLDRIDVNGDYGPSNCRWATAKEQQNNKRNNRNLEFHGETHTATEWAEIIGIKRVTLFHRLYAGWSVEQTLSKPLRENKDRRQKC